MIMKSVISLVSIVFSMILSGCGSSNPVVTIYQVEGVALTGYTLINRADDVVVVFGRDGNPNKVFCRRDDFILVGPSKDLKSASPAGTTWFDYVESNRSFQIYSSAKVAAYGKYAENLVWSIEAEKKLADELSDVTKKYPTQEEFQRYEYVLRRQAQFEEAQSEWKQEKKAFKK